MEVMNYVEPIRDRKKIAQIKNLKGMMIAAGQNLKRLIKHYQETFCVYARILISRHIPIRVIIFSKP